MQNFLRKNFDFIQSRQNTESAKFFRFWDYDPRWGGTPQGPENFLSPKFFKKKFRQHTVTSKRRICINFSILRLCPQVRVVTPKDPKIFQVQNYLRNNFQFIQSRQNTTSAKIFRFWKYVLMWGVPHAGTVNLTSPKFLKKTSFIQSRKTAKSAKIFRFWDYALRWGLPPRTQQIFQVKNFFKKIFDFIQSRQNTESAKILGFWEYDPRWGVPPAGTVHLLSTKFLKKIIKS